MANVSAVKIAFQGEPGANSHLAAREAYPAMEPLPSKIAFWSWASVRVSR